MKELIAIVLLWIIYKAVRYLWKSVTTTLQSHTAMTRVEIPTSKPIMPSLPDKTQQNTIATPDEDVEVVTVAEPIPERPGIVFLSNASEESEDQDSLLDGRTVSFVEDAEPLTIDDSGRKESIQELRRATLQDVFWPDERGEYSPYTHDTGTRHKDALALTHDEVLWLNEVRYWENDSGFVSEDFQVLVYRLYLRLCTELDSLSREGQFVSTIMHDALLTLDRWSLRDQYYRNCAIDALRNSTCNLVCSVARTALKTHYLKDDWSLPYEVSSSSNKVLNWDKVGRMALALVTELPVLSDDGFRKLFGERDGLWKKYWMQWEPQENRQKILWLWEVCRRSRYIHNVYLEGANELALSGENELALYGYAMHVIMAKRAAVKPKALSKQSRDRLYPDKAAASEWGMFFDSITSRENSKKIREKIHLRLNPPPKKVALNNRKLSKIEKAHTKTAQKLGAILSEDEDLNVQQDIEARAPAIRQTVKVPHVEFLRLVIDATAGLDKATLSAFARKTSIFPNKVLDDVNEYFYDMAGEPVIHDEGDKVVLCEAYRLLVQKNLNAFGQESQ